MSRHAQRMEPWQCRDAEDALLFAKGWIPGSEDTLSTGKSPLVMKFHHDSRRQFWTSRESVLKALRVGSVSVSG